MDVSAKRLLNYIRCRRYASLNDPDVFEHPFERGSEPLDVFRVFENLFFEDLSQVKKDVTLRFDFHRDIVLQETYHYLIEADGVITNYQIIPSSAAHFLKLNYRSKNHR